MDFEDQVAKLCYNKYNELKNSGKPQQNEWTVLSGVVLKNCTNQLSVISLCTGTKCLSGAELNNTSVWKTGSRLSDSHAEILARRAFLRYIYHQIELVQEKLKSEIFIMNDGILELKKNTTFHFFSSQSPCGDCSIIPKTKTNAHIERPCKIAKLDTTINEENEEDYDFVDDIYRTGAKCLNTEEHQDTYESGSKYHVLGPLRTKPGRGDRTLSLSCSDKMAKWIITGIQGSLLSIIVPTIRFDSIIIGGGCPFSIDSMERGLYKRFNHNFNVPIINQSKLPFSCLRSESRLQPCPSSVIWCNVPNRDTEVAIQGRKQGATKKKNIGHCLLISRHAFLESFFKVIEKSVLFKDIRHPKKIYYYHCKQASQSYQEHWTCVKSKFFNSWPMKHKELQTFTL